MAMETGNRVGSLVICNNTITINHTYQIVVDKVRIIIYNRGVTSEAETQAAHCKERMI